MLVFAGAGSSPIVNGHGTFKMKRPNRMNEHVFKTLNKSQDYRLQFYNEGKHEWISLLTATIAIVVFVLFFFSNESGVRYFILLIGAIFLLMSVQASFDERRRRKEWKRMLSIAEEFEYVTNVLVSDRVEEFSHRTRESLLNLAKYVLFLKAKINAMSMISEKSDYFDFMPKLNQIKTDFLINNYLDADCTLTIAFYLTREVSGDLIVTEENGMDDLFHKANQVLGKCATAEHWAEVEVLS